jgi:hypothetical protein
MLLGADSTQAPIQIACDSPPSWTLYVAMSTNGDKAGSAASSANESYAPPAGTYVSSHPVSQIFIAVQIAANVQAAASASARFAASSVIYQRLLSDCLGAHAQAELNPQEEHNQSRVQVAVS